MCRVEIVIDCVRAHSDSGDLHQSDRVFGRAVETGVFGERSVIGLLGGIEIAFDGNLGKRRYRQVYGLGCDHLQGLVHQCAHKLELVDVHRAVHECSKDRRRMVADEQHGFHPFAEFPATPVYVTRVVRRIEHATKPIGSLQLVPVHANVKNSGIRVAYHETANGDVFS